MEYEKDTNISEEEVKDVKEKEKEENEVISIGNWYIEIPSISLKAPIKETTDMNVIDEVITVDDEDARQSTIKLAQKEGILAGISSGAAIYAAHN